MLKELASLLCSLFVPRRAVSLSGGGILVKLSQCLAPEVSYA